MGAIAACLYIAGKTVFGRDEPAESAKSRPPPVPQPVPAVATAETSAPRIVERVIERQVVVMHCRFCKELTPVELSACKACGATLK